MGPPDSRSELSPAAATARRASAFKAGYFSLFLVGWAPFVLLCLYCQPQCDDLWFGGRVRTAGFFQAQVDWYTQWTGRYTSNVVNSLLGALPGLTEIYPVIPMLLMVVLACMAARAAREFGGEALSRLEAWGCGFIFVSLYLATMRLPSAGLFWFSSAVTYHLGHILLVEMLVRLSRASRLERPARWPAVAAYAAAGLLLAGVNELAMVLGAGIFAFGAAVLLVRKSPRARLWAGALAGNLAGIAIMLASPGNRVRAAEAPFRGNLSTSLLGGFDSLGEGLVHWLGHPAVVGAALLVGALAFLRHDRWALGRRLPGWLAMVLPVGVLAACYVMLAMHWWALGERPSLRVQTAVQFTFLAGLLASAAVWGVTAASRRRNTNVGNALTTRRELPGIARVVGILLMAVVLAECVAGENGRLALRDLRHDAPTYRAELARRYELLDDLRKQGVRTAVVPRLTAEPWSIFAFDMTPMPGSINNKSAALYHGFDELSVTAPPAR